MKAHNIIQKKSYDFALKIIILYKTITETKKEYILTKQLLKSGTSIGANVEEALGAQSQSDFLSKLSIAYKEARETHYWLRLLHESNYIDSETFNVFIFDCDELLKIIGTIQKNNKGS